MSAAEGAAETAASSGASLAARLGKAGSGVVGGLGLGGVADWADNGRFDTLGNAVAEVARRGGDVLAAVGELVNRVTPEFVSDIIPQGVGAAGEAAGVIAPYSADALAVLGVVA